MKFGIHRWAKSSLLFLLLCSVVFALCLSAAPAFAQSGSNNETSWVIQPVNVIDVRTGEVLPNRAVKVRAGRIKSISEAAPVEEGIRVIDGANGWLIPGLTEMHAHVPPIARGDQAVQDVLTLFLANGVTTIRGMLGEPGHLKLRQQLQNGERTGPALVTSGPSFNGNSVSDAAQGAERVREQNIAGYDFLKIHPGLSREEFIAIARAAHELDMPFAGHVSFATGLDTALAERQTGIDHLDAYAEAMVPEDSALAGTAPSFFGVNLASAMDSSLAPELARRTAEAGVWQSPTQSLLETTAGALSIEALQARPGMDVLSEELLASWVASVNNIRGDIPMADREQYLSARRALLKAMQDAGVGLVLGSDAPQIMNVPGYSAHQELEYLVGAGLTPLQALQTGTINSAAYFGRDDMGEIAPGHVADLILLSANPLDDISNTQSILGVAREARFYPRDLLDKWVDAVRRRGL